MSVLLFTGHRIDGPDRQLARFPPALVPSVQLRIRGALAGMAVLAPLRAAVCSLAAGGDLLFAQACLQHHIKLFIVLPFRQADFVPQSVTYAKAAGHKFAWLKLYRRVLRAASKVEFSSPAAAHPGGHQFLHCNQMMLERAQQLAAAAHTSVQALLLLEPGPQALAGGSQHFRTLLRKQGINLRQMLP